MKLKHALIAFTSIALIAAGCSSAGLSPREEPGRTQSLYLYSLYEGMPQEARNAPAQPLRLPAAVAVVQVGEAAPPAQLVTALRGDPNVFGRIESLPGIVNEVGTGGGGGDNWRPTDATAYARSHMTALRNLAADMGMDYLLLVGGTVDYGTSGTPLSLMDLTIVGAFLVPSQETQATARANGALIDVASGRVVVNSAAEAHRDSLVPLASVDGEQAKLLTKLRDDVLGKLGAQVIADTRLRAVSWGGRQGAGARMPVTNEPPAPDAPRYQTTEAWGQQ